MRRNRECLDSGALYQYLRQILHLFPGFLLFGLLFSAKIDVPSINSSMPTADPLGISSCQGGTTSNPNLHTSPHHLDPGSLAEGLSLPQI